MSEILRYDITVKAGADYAIDFSYEEDDGTVMDMTDWGIEAQLREYPEAQDYHDFDCSADEYGFHLAMSGEESKKIGYTRGTYDVFITSPDNSVRDKLIMGKAYIIPEVTR